MGNALLFIPQIKTLSYNGNYRKYKAEYNTNECNASINASYCFMFKEDIDEVITFSVVRNSLLAGEYLHDIFHETNESHDQNLYPVEDTP